MSFQLLAKQAALMVLVLTTGLMFQSCTREETPRLLVFSKTEGFRHQSIEAGQEALRKMASEQGWEVEFSENDSMFYEESLMKFHAVVFLNTTGDILNPEQQNNFERFIQAGGGYVGIHSATDTEYDWPWYGKLAGAYFRSHPNDPNVKEGEFYVVNHDHEACQDMPERFTRMDEFYNFNDINPDINVLVKIDESTYTGGENGDDHPMSWYHEYDGGRAFYTAMGHTEETFSEELFLKHLKGGINYVIGGEKATPLDYNKVTTLRMPEENRFSKVVLEDNLNEPMELAILPDGDILFIERHGAIKYYDQAMQETKVLDSIAVNTTYTNGREAEDGLLGLTIDPDFEENHWVYFYYSPAGDDPKNELARVTFNNGTFDWDSKQVIIEVPVQRVECCHTGGSMAWDTDGNLFLSTGDNTNPHATGYGPVDERPDRGPWDAQKSSGNTNDLRGSILRIHPEEDGSYSIPDGNLFAEGTPNTRPEIYVKGNRNPYRISFDQRTGYLYWGEVGPDAREDSSTLGSRGYDEVNQAKGPGFFGWPYFVGNNYAYGDHNFETGEVNGTFAVSGATNNSPNSTGLETLPPAQPAFIWYPYAESEDFPLVGSGSRNAMAGPVFYSDDFQRAHRPFPAYYHGKLLTYDWMRGWIMAVTMDENGDFQSMERFMPSHKFSNPMDMAFHHDGDLYILEYGSSWFSQNEDARLVRIEYTAGNRKPEVHLNVAKTAGATPFTVDFGANGTQDPDGDELSYRWSIEDEEGKEIVSASGVSGSHTIAEPGEYRLILTVDDGNGGLSTSTQSLKAGNEPPTVNISIVGGNSGFFFPGESFSYEVTVNDKEDGSSSEGDIDPASVAITIDYLPEGYDKNIIAAGHKSADDLSASSGLSLMKDSDCMSCHQISRASIGPTYTDVAMKYRDDPDAPAYLAEKIKNGGGGVWGEVAMAAHPNLSDEDAGAMVDYILSLGDADLNMLPLSGSYRATIEPGQSDQGIFIIRAAYTDNGANGIGGLQGEQVLVLRNANLEAFSADEVEGVMKLNLSTLPVKLLIAENNDSWFRFDDLDLTGIGAVMVAVTANAQYGFEGGSMEVHLDAPDGPLLGSSEMIEPTTPAPGSSPRQQASLVRIALEESEGIHDLYFVCQRAEPGEGNLFAISNVMFQVGRSR